MLEKLQRVLYFSAFLGTVPFFLEQLNQHALQIVTIIFYFVLNTFLLTLALVYYRLGEFSIITNFIAGTLYITQVMTSMLMFCEIAFYRKAHFKLMQQLLQVELFFRQHLQLFLQAWHTTGTIPRKYTYSILILTVHSLLNILLIIFTNIQSYHYFLIPTLIVLYGRGLILTLYVDILNEYLHMLNAKLRSIINSQAGLYSMDIKTSDINSLAYLLKLRTAYGHIFKLCTHFNSGYGWSLFLFVMILTFEITTMFYWFVLTLTGVFEFHYLVFDGGVLLVRIYLLLLMCYSCECCKNEVCI